MRPRRFLPSISLLTAFESVMRTGSVTAAARDLDLTQSTVSRLIQTLEEQLGRPLFIRRSRRLVPTEAADAYLRDVTRALDTIQRASTRVVTNAEGASLSLAVLPTFGTRWLAPRLGRFLDRNPGILVNFATRIDRFSLEASAFDAVIYFGVPDWPRTSQVKLFDECYTACAAPSFLDRHPITGPGDLAGLPLLQLETRMEAWGAWFDAQGGARPPAEGMLMDQFSMMIQTAIEGLGIALLPDYLAQVEIAQGRLRSVLRPSVPGPGAYWFAWPDEAPPPAPLLAFREWIMTQGADGA